MPASWCSRDLRGRIWQVCVQHGGGCSCDERDAPPRWAAPLLKSISLAFWGVVIAAFIRRETALLGWVFLGQLHLLGLTPSLLRRSWLTGRRHAVVCRLRQRIGANDATARPADAGAEGWLTGSGVYLANGELFDWERFSACQVEAAGPAMYRLALTRRTWPASHANKWLWGIEGIYIILATCITIAAAVAGLLRWGARADVLVAILSSGMHLAFWSVIGTFLWRTRRRRVARDCSRPPLVLQLDAANVRPGELESWLERHLPGAVTLSSPGPEPDEPAPGTTTCGRQTSD